MKKTTNFLLVVIITIFVTTLNAQHRRYAITNGIALQGGVTQFDIITDNFITQKNSGWLGGLSATLDLPNKWYNLSYNLQLSESNVDISASPIISGSPELVEYKLMMAQASLIMHIKLIGPNITLDAGPMIQYNGQLELKDENKENHIITGYQALRAGDISDISKFNINSSLGLSAGFGNFKLRGQYIYGFTNILNKLNKQDLNSGSNSNKFKGNLSLLVFTAMITF